MKEYFDQRLMDMIMSNVNQEDDTHNHIRQKIYSIKKHSQSKAKNADRLLGTRNSYYFEAMVRLVTLKRFLIDVNHILETEVTEITSLFAKSVKSDNDNQKTLHHNT